MSLIAWWKLDNNAYDYSPTKNNGTATGLLSYTAAGIIGQAGDFTGDRETYIDVSSLTLTDHYTIAFWMYGNTATPGSAAGSMVMGTFNIGTNWMYAADGLRFRFNDGSSRTWASDNDFYHKWRHVVLVLDTSTVTLYLDAVNQGALTYDGTFIIDNIGAPYTTNSFDYNGYLNDIRIYDHKLSKKEIKVLAQCKVVHYRFSEDRGAQNLIVTDSSDYGYHADAFGASDRPTWGNTSPGQGVGYYTFDSNDDIKLTITNKFHGRADLDVAWTTAAWVKMTDAGSSQRLVDGLHADIYLQFSTSNYASIRPHVIAYYLNSIVLSSVLYDNSWHQIVFVFDNRISDMHIYVDAVDVSGTIVGDNGTALTTGLGTWLIGSLSACSIADFRFYNTPLSPEDVLGLYQTSAQIDDRGNFWC